MKDRFKFRYFYNKKIKMYDVMCFDLEANTVTINTDETHFLTIEETDFKNLLQCTGLKDKNGKLIFEGDVVKVGDDIYQIVYEIGSFMLTAKDEKVINKFKDNWNDNVYPLSQFYFNNENENNYINEVEIIGNIYENPELIESEEQ